METLMNIKDILNDAVEFVKVNNFYFEEHSCNVSNKTYNVNLNYTIKENSIDELTLFGYCKDCKTVFYNKDFSSKNL